MNTILYIRDFSEKLTFSNLTPIERLLLSIHLTKYVERDNRDSVEILFSLTKDLQGDSYRRWLCYKDYVEADDKMKQSSRSFLFDNVIRQAKESLKDLHYVKIDLEKLNMNGKCSLYNIAFKAFVIGASMHTCKEENVDWFDIPLRCWCNCPTKSLSRIWNEISNWLDENGIKAERRDKWLHVFNKYGQSGQNIPEKMTKKDVINRFKENESKIEENTKKVEENKITDEEEEAIAKAEAIKQQAIEEAQKEVEEETDETEEDEFVDIQEEYEYWEKTYRNFQQKYPEKVSALLRFFIMGDANHKPIFSIGDEMNKIAKKYHTKVEVVDNVLAGGFVEDKDGGALMKSALKKELQNLRDSLKIRCLQDDSWQKNSSWGKLLLGYAYVAYPKLMTI